MTTTCGKCGYNYDAPTMTTIPSNCPKCFPPSVSVVTTGIGTNPPLNTTGIEEVLRNYGRDLVKLIDDDNENPRDRFALQEEINAALSQASQAIADLVERREREAVEKHSEVVAGWLQYKPDVFNKACNQCGGEMMVVRGEHPGSEDRVLCPTCLDDIRRDVISNLTQHTRIASQSLDREER